MTRKEKLKCRPCDSNEKYNADVCIVCGTSSDTKMKIVKKNGKKAKINYISDKR